MTPLLAWSVAFLAVVALAPRVHAAVVRARCGCRPPSYAHRVDGWWECPRCFAWHGVGSLR